MEANTEHGADANGSMVGYVKVVPDLAMYRFHLQLAYSALTDLADRPDVAIKHAKDSVKAALDYTVSIDTANHVRTVLIAGDFKDGVNLKLRGENFNILHRYQGEPLPISNS